MLKSLILDFKPLFLDKLRDMANNISIHRLFIITNHSDLLPRQF